MPSYEMTAQEQQEYGNSLTIWQAIRLLQTWHPLVSYGQRFVAATDPYVKSLIVSEALEWLAAKTDSALDDQLVRHISAVARTGEGEALIRFCLAMAGVK